MKNNDHASLSAEYATSLFAEIDTSLFAENDTLLLSGNNSRVVGVSCETIISIIDTRTKKDLSILSDIINNGTTNVELKENELTIDGGSYRGGRASGPQQIDIGDVCVRKDWKIGSGTGALMHEMVEAYYDQVINKSPVSDDDNVNFENYLFAHNPAIVIQAKIDGLNYFRKQLNAEGVHQLFARKDVVNKDGTITSSWYLVEYTREGENGVPTLIRSGVTIENVVQNQNGEVTSYCESGSNVQLANSNDNLQ